MILYGEKVPLILGKPQIHVCCGSAFGLQERAPELTSGDSANGVPTLSNTAPQLGEPNKLQPLGFFIQFLGLLCTTFSVCIESDKAMARSLSEMRKDSTTLIRKYLDEMKRLETELVLYRRRTKQLQEELKEARDDLQKDEEIFEEKMKEMKDSSFV